MKRVSIALLSFFVGMWMTGAIATASDVAKLIGQYAVDGKNPDGSKYFGVAWIAKGTAEGTIQVGWSLTEGDAQSTNTGTGTLQADGTWKVAYSGTASGEQIYKVNPDGSLEGSFTEGGATGTERLIPVQQLLAK